MYNDEADDETSQVEVKEELSEIMEHLRQASRKFTQLILRGLTYIAVKLLAVLMIIIQVVLLVLKYLCKLISMVFYHLMRLVFSVFPFLSSLLLYKHDRKDPFKRNLAPTQDDLSNQRDDSSKNANCS